MVVKMGENSLRSRVISYLEQYGLKGMKYNEEFVISTIGNTEFCISAGYKSIEKERIMIGQFVGRKFIFISMSSVMNDSDIYILEKENLKERFYNAIDYPISAMGLNYHYEKESNIISISAEIYEDGLTCDLFHKTIHDINTSWKMVWKVLDGLISCSENENFNNIYI